MLNPSLDDTALAARFATHRRLQVRDILLPEAAVQAHRCLAEDLPWSFTYRLDGQNHLRAPAELQAMPPEERAAVGRRILEQARSEFTFGFMTYPLLRNHREGRDLHLFVHRVLEALGSPAFIGFVRAVTADERIARVDAQATRYGPGHFLSLHDDRDDAGEVRRCAYVLNLSDGWRADWGGLLQFVDEDGSVAESFVPHFNSMSLFAVPARHLVSYVAPYAVLPRLSIAGWFTGP